MIKLKLTRDNDQGPLLVFGLSDINMKKLREGRPIHVDLAALGMQGEIMIFTGRNEQSMLKDLENAGLVPAAAASGRPS